MSFNCLEYWRILNTHNTKMIKFSPSASNNCLEVICLLFSSFFSHMRLNKEKLAREGFEPATSRLLYRHSTNWAIQPYVGSLPVLSIFLFWGASQKPYSLCNWCVARDLTQVYDTKGQEAAARGSPFSSSLQLSQFVLKSWCYACNLLLKHKKYIHVFAVSEPLLAAGYETL